MTSLARLKKDIYFRTIINNYSRNISLLYCVQSFLNYFSASFWISVDKLEVDFNSSSYTRSYQY